MRPHLVFLLLLFWPSCGLWAESPKSIEESRSEETPKARGAFGAHLDYEEEAGRGRFRVVNVVPGGPSDQAGLQAGDIVTAVNGVPFRFRTSLQRHEAFLWLEPGDRVTFHVIREDETEKDIEILAEAMRPEHQRQWAEIIEKERQLEVVERVQSGANIEVRRTAEGELHYAMLEHPDIKAPGIKKFLELTWFFPPVFAELQPGDRIVLGPQPARPGVLINVGFSEAPDYIQERLHEIVAAGPP